jgi:DNA-binding PadR family transcriptional regulator
VRTANLSLEIALLGFLRREPMHGYAIHHLLSDPDGLGPVWGIKLGRLYAMLSRLEEAGCVSTSTEPQESKPPRKVYHLTDTGRETFEAWLSSPVRHGRSLRLEFLVKLYFVRLEEPEDAGRLLARQREQCRAWLAAEQTLADTETSGDRPYGRLVHRFRIGQIRAMLEWLDKCEEEFTRVR